MKQAETDVMWTKPKNLIIQWDMPSVVVKKQFIDLGVIRVSPEEYIARYGSSLKTYAELPDFVKEIRPAENLPLASQVTTRTVTQLEGDLDALSLIDLDREGLSEYKRYVKTSQGAVYSKTFPTNWISGASSSGFKPTTQTRQQKTTSSSFDSMFDQALLTIQPQSRDRLSMNEARVILALMNEKQGKRYNEIEVERFLSEINPNKEEWVDSSLLKSSLYRLR